MSFHSKGMAGCSTTSSRASAAASSRSTPSTRSAPSTCSTPIGRQLLPNGHRYRPHQAILSEIHRAQRSIKLCLFLIGEMTGEHEDSVIDALIQAQGRGVDVQVILNGHLARKGDPGRECTMAEELARPLLPAVYRLKRAGVPVLAGLRPATTSPSPTAPSTPNTASSTTTKSSKAASTGTTPPPTRTISTSSPPTRRRPDLFTRVAADTARVPGLSITCSIPILSVKSTFAPSPTNWLQALPHVPQNKTEPANFPLPTSPPSAPRACRHWPCRSSLAAGAPICWSRS